MWADFSSCMFSVVKPWAGSGTASLPNCHEKHFRLCSISALQHTAAGMTPLIPMNLVSWWPVWWRCVPFSCSGSWEGILSQVKLNFSLCKLALTAWAAGLWQIPVSTGRMCSRWPISEEHLWQCKLWLYLVLQSFLVIPAHFLCMQGWIHAVGMLEIYLEAVDFLLITLNEMKVSYLLKWNLCTLVIIVFLEL